MQTQQVDAEIAEAERVKDVLKSSGMPEENIEIQLKMLKAQRELTASKELLEKERKRKIEELEVNISQVETVLQDLQNGGVSSHGVRAHLSELRLQRAALENRMARLSGMGPPCDGMSSAVSSYRVGGQPEAGKVYQEYMDSFLLEANPVARHTMR